MEDDDELPSSDHMDPLYDLSGLSLFPRTIRDSTTAPKPNHTDDLESIHGFMKSMVLRNPRKHSEQAKAIVDGNLERLNSSFSSFMASEDKFEDVTTKGKENARERRPGLGHRRARFSFKPNSSQPFVSVESTLDIDELQDPEAYFLAHVKLENTQKEIRRQIGGNLADLNDCNMSRTERRRRPGILGKSVNYKHRYSSMLPQSDDTFMSSQVPLEQVILSPPTYISQPETAVPSVEMQEKELTGSISKTEDKVNGLLDELLSDNYENLDEDGVLSILQDRLQIKPLDLDELCLPDFHDVGKNDFMDLGDMPKPRKTLSDICNLVGEMSCKTPVKHKQVAESPVHSLVSPTPPKSPFASIYLLKKRFAQSNLLNNPFLPLDLSPARNSSSVQHVDEQSDHSNTGKKFRVFEELKPLIAEIGDARVDDAGSQEMITEDSVTQFESFANDNSSRHGVGIHDLSSGSHVDLIDNDGSSNMDVNVVDDNESRLNTDIEVQTNGPKEMKEHDIRINTDVVANGPNEMTENVGDMLQEAVPSEDVNCGESSQTDGPTKMEKNVIQTDVPDEMEKDVEDLREKAQPDINVQSSPAELRPCAVDGPLETSDVIPQQHIEEPSRVSLKERSTEKRPPRAVRKRKTLSHRQSLAGAGTSWESGVRRSKRIRMRPLEYWRGERFLYGRVHESLTTIIGVKYVSPAKGNGESSIRVKSYVSDEYKELVELSALH